MISAPDRVLKTIVTFAKTAGGTHRVEIHLLTNEIAAAIGLSARATRTRLARLAAGGLLREIGTGPQDPRRRYFPAE